MNEFYTRSMKPQQGSSLLEVLVAILIMSFGLLALGGLTASSLRYSKMTQFQMIGAQLAADYSDRMRSNMTGFESGAYDRTAAYSSTLANVTVPTCADAAKCTAAELSAIDQAEWTNALRQRLPGGAAYVVRNAVNTLAADVWVMWSEPNLVFGATTLSVANSGDCPNAAVSGLSAGTSLPRCMYFRVSL